MNCRARTPASLSMVRVSPGRVEHEGPVPPEERHLLLLRGTALERHGEAVHVGFAVAVAVEGGGPRRGEELGERPQAVPGGRQQVGGAALLEDLEVGGQVAAAADEGKEVVPALVLAEVVEGAEVLDVGRGDVLVERFEEAEAGILQGDPGGADHDVRRQAGGHGDVELLVSRDPVEHLDLEVDAPVGVQGPEVVGNLHVPVAVGVQGPPRVVEGHPVELVAGDPEPGVLRPQGDGDRVPVRGFARAGTGKGSCQGSENEKPRQAGGAAKRGCN